MLTGSGGCESHVRLSLIAKLRKEKKEKTKIANPIHIKF